MRRAIRSLAVPAVLLAALGGVSVPAVAETDHPPALGIPMLADLPSDEVLLFGGLDPTFKVQRYAWIFDADPSGWTRVLGSPTPPRALGGMAYDERSDVVVLYLGGRGFTPTSETWLFDPTTRRWRQAEGTGAPIGLLGPSVVYDSGSDRIVMFGGLDLTTFEVVSDTWIYDTDADTWTQGTPNASPPARNFAAMAYDAGSDRVVLFGGAGGDFFQPLDLDDTWTYDTESDTWTEVSPSGSPSRRSYPTAAYDPATDRVILFGGGEEASGITQPVGDTWAYDTDSNTWSELHPETTPSARAFHGMAMDTSAGLVVMYGGGPSREAVTDETWVFDPASEEWSLVG